MKTYIFYFLVNACCFFSAVAQQNENRADTLRFLLEIPLLDLPYQSIATQTRGNFLKSYTNTSMAQSLALSNGFYCASHYGIKKAFMPIKSTFLRKLLTSSALLAADFASTSIPFGLAWLHEEYHRAVLTKNRANSFNDVYKFSFGSSVIAVSRLKDSDLARISDYHKEDFRRLQTAGIEAQYHQIQTLQKYNFYYHQKIPHQILYWFSTINSTLYVSECATTTIDKLIDEMNEKEGKDISRRDFTGPDFTAWADALFFPEKPYSARGIHPSGVGINRYVKYADLSSDAKAYLKKQGNR